MQRLAALVPRPRLHLIRLHCVLAPHARLRALLVPLALPAQAEGATAAAAAAECEAETTVQDRPQRISWARLLKRVFDIDMQHCPNCSAGEMNIIAARAREPGLHFAAGQRPLSNPHRHGRHCAPAVGVTLRAVSCKVRACRCEGACRARSTADSSAGLVPGHQLEVS